MNIGSSILHHYDDRISGAVEQPKNMTAKDVGSQTAIDFSNLKEGAVFKGEILDIQGEKVTIALDNDATLMARMQGDVQLGIGDRLLFSVKENLNNQILIKPMFDSLYSAQTQTLEKALEAAQLSPTERNFTVAKELMDAGMPLDRSTMVRLLAQSVKFEGTSVRTLAALLKTEIPVTEENIAQYERYQNHEHQLLGDLGNTAEEVADFVKFLPDSLSSDEMLDFTKQILSIFGEETAAVQGHSEEYTEQMSAEPEQMIVNADVRLEQMAEETSKQVKPSEALKLTDHPVMQTLSKGEWQQLQQELMKLEVPVQQLDGLIKNTNSVQEFLTELTQTLPPQMDSAALRELLSSDPFQKLMSGLVKEQWALNPKEMKDPKEIDSLYERISRQTKEFEGTLSAKGGNAGQFQQNTENMRQNLHFMEQLNQQMIYAQMPLKLSNQNANSELYVYADKRKLQQKKDGISVMLHLDMDNLGMTDVKVTLTGTTVNARFYLNDDASVEIVADHMPQLAKQLGERGFSLTNEVIKRQPQTSVNQVVDEVIDANAEKSIRRYTFDART